MELLGDAGRILLASVGASSSVAKDFGYKLMKLGKAVLVESDTHVQVANEATLNPGDLVFAISESGETQDVVRQNANGYIAGWEVDLGGEKSSSNLS